MIVCVGGSRSIEHVGLAYGLVKTAMSRAWHERGIIATAIMEGGAAGIDLAAGSYAAQSGLQHIPFHIPDWLWRYMGSKAGPFRNRAMAAEAQAYVGIWDGRSRGTRNMLKEAHARKLRIAFFLCRDSQLYLFPEHDRVEQIY